MFRKLRKQEADAYLKEQKEIEVNPLIQYSTSDIKKELRRRKGR